VAVSWVRVLTFHQTWAFFIVKFLTDPTWWFYLFWLPSFLEGENARKVRDYIAANPGFTGDKADVPGVISWPFAVPKAGRQTTPSACRSLPPGRTC